MERRGGRKGVTKRSEKEGRQIEKEREILGERHRPRKIERARKKAREEERKTERSKERKKERKKERGTGRERNQ